MDTELNTYKEYFEEFLKLAFPKGEFKISFYPTIGIDGKFNMTISWDDGVPESWVTHIVKKFRGVNWGDDNKLHAVKYANCPVKYEDGSWHIHDQETLIGFIFTDRKITKSGLEKFLADLNMLNRKVTGREDITLYINGTAQRDKKRDPAWDYVENIAMPAKLPKAIDPAKLRADADKLQKRIDEYTAPRLSNTHRRREMASSAYEKGIQLRNVQSILRRLADLWENNEIPIELRYIRSKADIDRIYMLYVPNPILGSNYVHDDRFKRLALYHKMQVGSAERLDDIHNYFYDFSKPDPKVERERKLREWTARATSGNIPGFFPTPDHIIKLMIEIVEDRLKYKKPFSVLEPSAGMGSIADMVKERWNPTVLHVAEWNNTLTSILKEKGYYHIGSDCMNLPPNEYDVIIMNPPFENMRDTEHVMHLYNNHLAPGGVLISVMSPSWTFANFQKAHTFRKFKMDNSGDWEPLPEKSFRESAVSTDVNTGLFVIEKPNMTETLLDVPRKINTPQGVKSEFEPGQTVVITQPTQVFLQSYKDNVFTIDEKERKLEPGQEYMYKASVKHNGATYHLLQHIDGREKYLKQIWVLAGFIKPALKLAEVKVNG